MCYIGIPKSTGKFPLKPNEIIRVSIFIIMYILNIGLHLFENRLQFPIVCIRLTRRS